MKAIQSHIEQTILSYFDSPKHSLMHESNGDFIIRISLDEEGKEYPITISIPLLTLKHFLAAPEKSKSKFDERLQKEIKHRISKFNGESDTWIIDLHVPL